MTLTIRTTDSKHDNLDQLTLACSPSLEVATPALRRPAGASSGRRLQSTAMNSTLTDDRTAVASERAGDGERASVRTRRWRLDWVEWAMLAVFIALSMWMIGLYLWQVIVHGRVWTHTDGPYLTDQMQYLAWVQAASKQLLISDLFRIHGSAPDYLQPLIAISGVLTALGTPAWLAWLLWKPVGVLAAFFAVRSLTRATIADHAGRWVALALGLFGGFFPSIGDLWIPFWSWGYPFALIAVAALAAGLLAYDHARRAQRFSIWPPACGAMAAWLHPWQGETLILIILSAEALSWLTSDRSRPPRPRLTLATATTLATITPLLYYVVLAHVDPQWAMAKQYGAHHIFSMWPILQTLAPFLLAAAWAYAQRPPTFLELTVRLWLPAAFVVFAVAQTRWSSTPLHAFAGITIPLGVLAVQSARRLTAAICAHWPDRRAAPPRAARRILAGLAVLAVATLTIPAAFTQLRGGYQYAQPSPTNATFITRSERQALNYLASANSPGGVLAPQYLGLIIPAETGRRTYVGTLTWSQPNFSQRRALAQRALTTLPPAAARAAILGTGARFVLNSTCTIPARDVTQALAPITLAAHHFGCATVYLIR